MADVAEYNYHRMKGFLLYKVKHYGIDMVLFMLEAMYRDFMAEQKPFNINKFDDYVYIARQYVDDSKNNATDPYYVKRERHILY